MRAVGLTSAWRGVGARHLLRDFGSCLASDLGCLKDKLFGLIRRPDRVLSFFPSFLSLATVFHSSPRQGQAALARRFSFKAFRLIGRDL